MHKLFIIEFILHGTDVSRTVEDDSGAILQNDQEEKCAVIIS